MRIIAHNLISIIPYPVQYHCTQSLLRGHTLPCKQRSEYVLTRQGKKTCDRACIQLHSNEAIETLCTCISLGVVYKERLSLVRLTAPQRHPLGQMQCLVNLYKVDFRIVNCAGRSMAECSNGLEARRSDTLELTPKGNIWDEVPKNGVVEAEPTRIVDLLQVDH